jgi:DNA-directed RNA polymerase subunit beta'
MGESAYDRINDYGAVKIGLASPYDIRSWSFGEVKKPETINYRTYRPEKDGLFCERIFGPEKDWECACGKYRGMKYKGMICDRCGVKVTHSRVRRKRMGHIELAAPVVHIWFFKAMPSRLGTLLDMKTTSMERIIYFQDYVVVDPGDTPLKERQLLTEEDFRKAREQFGDAFQADMGADAVRKLLARLDLVSLSKTLRTELGETSSKQKTKDLTKRLKVVESLRDSDNRPEWMVLECIPVIPPDLRPSSCSIAATSPPATSTTSTGGSSTATTGSRSWSTSMRPRSSSATRSGCSSRPSTPSSTTTAASGPSWARATAR